MIKIFKNKNLYNAQGERVAIYGKIVDLWQMELTVIKCNRKDQFSRKTADKLYSEGKGLKFNIVLDNLSHPGQKFNYYCRTNFYILKIFDFQQRKLDRRNNYYFEISAYGKLLEIKNNKIYYLTN